MIDDLDLRFAPYEHLDIGILVVAYAQNSPILWCNRHFANLLSAYPGKLKTQSLDEIVKSETIAYELASQLIGNPKNVALSGGFDVEFYSEYRPMVRALRVKRLELGEGREGTFLIAYIRPLTSIERFLHRTRLNSRIDFIWRPIANFCLAGKWRPILTTTSPLWLHYLSTGAPHVADFFEKLLNIGS